MIVPVMNKQHYIAYKLAQYKLLKLDKHLQHVVLLVQHDMDLLHSVQVHAFIQEEWKQVVQQVKSTSL